MNTNAISTLPQTDLSALTGLTSGSSSSLDFAQILAGLQTQSTGATGFTSDTLTSDTLLSSDLSSLLGVDIYGELLSNGLLNSELLTSSLLGESLNIESLGIDGVELTQLEGLAGGILELLSGLQNSGEEDTILALIANLQTELKRLSEEQGQMVLGEQLMALLAQMTNQTLTPTLQTDGSLTWTLPNSAQAISTFTNAAPQDVLQWLQGGSFSNPQNQSAQVLQAQNTTSASTGNESATPLASLPTQDTASTQTQATSSQGQPNTNLSGESGSQASSSSSTENGELQAASNANLPLQTGVVTTGNVTASNSAQSFLTQMQSGIEIGLQSGLDEFRVTLVPEGLGEVLVQLTQTENGLMLTLIAQNAETQRLLAADLEQLRNSLSPLKVEVQEVLSGQEAELLNQQDDAQRQRHLYWQAQSEQSLVRRGIRGDTQTLQEPAETVLKQPDSMLDTYI